MDTDEKNEEKEENEISTPDVITSEEKDANASLAPAESDNVKSEETEMNEGDSRVSENKEKILKPGAQLAAYREAAGITLEQVASSLKMTVQQVSELEADNYEKLHGVAISRGFVRAYAKLLQVDPTPLVAMFAEEKPTKHLDQIHRTKPAGEFVQNRQPFGKQKKGKAIWILVIIVILGLIYAGYSMKWFSSDSKSAKKKTEVVSEVKKTEPKPEVVKKKDEQPTEKIAEKKEVTEPVKTEMVKPEPVEPEKMPESKPVEKEEKTDLSKPSPEKIQEQPPAKPNALVLYFRGSSEIQLLKADGSLLREFEGQAGSVEKIDITEPVTVVIEKALNVQAEFREQPIVLRTARKSSEAKISLK